MTYYVITTNFHGESSELISFKTESELKEFLVSEIEKLLYSNIIYDSRIHNSDNSIYTNKTISELLDIIKELCLNKKKNFDIFARFIYTVFKGELLYCL